MKPPQRDPMEADLLRRAQAGDEEALVALLRLWQPALESIARTLHRRHARLGFDTHDLVATAIRRLLHLGAGQVGDATGRVALSRILRSAYVDKVREEVSRRRRQAEAIRAAPPRQDAPTPPAEVPAGLSADDWELVLLWKQGLSWAQIGEHLGIPLNTARKRWHRLMSRLRQRQSRRAAEPDPRDDASAPQPSDERVPGPLDRTTRSSPSDEAASRPPVDPEAPRAEDRPSDRAADHDPRSGPPA